MPSEGKNPIRVYVDTSVFGGVFDEEFSEASRTFFSLAQSGEFTIVVSSTVTEELKGAPDPVRAFYFALAEHIEEAVLDNLVLDLRSAYLEASIVGSKWEADALHVAAATVSKCQAIVSWNFKHIVNFRRIPLYNGVNAASGFPAIAIHTPQEVIFHGDED